jgi:glycosyltransferase involved in cell wall biosynthesis
MTRLLLISYWYPPVNAIASVRAAKFVKYLPQYDVEPIVLTSRFGTITSPRFLGQDVPNGAIVYRTRTFDAAETIKNLLSFNASIYDSTTSILTDPGPVKRRITRLYYSIFDTPDPQLGWYILSQRRAVQIARDEKIDIIVSSSPPGSAHLLAAHVKKKTGLPWIADYRDLWSNNHYYYVKGNAMRRIDAWLERKALEAADRLITVSAPLAERLCDYLKRDVEIIPNGFDPDDYEPAPSPQNKIVIVYTGNIYKGKRDPSILFVALREMLDSGEINRETIAVEFYGRRFEGLREAIGRYNLNAIASIRGFVDYRRSLSLQHGATLLLMLDWLGEEGVTSGKIFEYLGAMRPILCLGETPQNEVGRLLRTAKAGIYCATPEEAKTALRPLIKMFHDRGEITYQGIPSEIARFSRREGARKLAEILHETITSTKSRILTNPTSRCCA